MDDIRDPWPGQLFVQVGGASGDPSFGQYLSPCLLPIGGMQIAKSTAFGSELS